jgi:hypothetical protein
VTLGNMRDLGVQRLIFLSQPGLPSHCTDRSLERTLKSHTSKAESSAPSAQPKIDVRPNWKEQTQQASLTGKVWR